MNKEIIKKYKDVFDWWLNGGMVWVKYDDNGWSYINREEYSWQYPECVYVQDDEYAEFRKALADGKTVLFKSHVVCREVPMVGNNFNQDIEDYRIKPDEPKFKVGDWVRDKTNCTIVKLGEHYYEGGVELWKPKVDEWCWFWTSSTNPALRQFNATQPNGLHKTTVGQFLYASCEPFIGELPTPYKDK